MKERPILFSGAMVRALLAGTKTQTRRVVKPWEPRPDAASKAVPADVAYLPDFTCYRSTCPYGQPGDRLVVRETWQYADWTPDGYPFIRYAADGEKRLIETGIPEEWEGRLGEEWAQLSVPRNFDIDGCAADRRWRPAIHMPRWACRIVLEIVSVRVERLQDISEADALAEGVANSLHLPGGRFARENFEHLWWTINGDGSWEANPWVWVISFRRIDAS